MPTRRRHIGSESEQSINCTNIESTPAIYLAKTMTRDRTVEFVNAVRSLQGRYISRAVAARDVRQVKCLQHYSDFMMAARNIGRNIASTYSKLEKLTLLAKRKSLFDDKPAEIQELTYIIKEDLKNLNDHLARLQELSRGQSGPHSSPQHLQSHSNTVVLTLQSKLASMSTNFKQILDVRSENLKQAKSRRDHFSQGPLPSPSTSSSGLNRRNHSLLLSDEERHVSIEMGATPQASTSSQQQQMLMAYDESEQYMQSRVDAMQNIESTVVELGTIFTQLAHMVSEQEEMVQRIDANIIDTELNIEAAHQQILRYFKSVTSNRWLMIKIFAVIIIFFTFFIIFLT